MSPLKGTRPYFIRAIYEWLVDANLTPYLLVDAAWLGCELPQDFVEEGEMVLNIKPSAVRDLVLGNEAVMFSARFGGRPMVIQVPIGAVLRIFAKETGDGLFFDPSEYSPEPPTGSKAEIAKEKAAKPRPFLSVVK
ncbi:MAG: ClpXP protease specificity-enhancing factor [Paraperlucidibaca sp.]